MFNVGSGQHYTIKELAERLATVLGKEYLEAEITGKYRWAISGTVSRTSASPGGCWAMNRK